jgi:hypothetical protein
VANGSNSNHNQGGKMKITVGKYELEIDRDCKIVPDGVEIFQATVDRLDITPADFDRADWEMGGGIIVEN